MPVSYDLPTVLISLVAAIGAAAIALSVIYQPSISWPRIVLGGVFMGAGIGVMHYVGMYAMRMEAHTRYDLRYFLLSVVVAVLVAILALWFAVQTIDNDIKTAGDTASVGILMGLGIASMHYTAMFAATFVTTNVMIGNTTFAAQLSGAWVGGLILATLIVLGRDAVGRTRQQQPGAALPVRPGLRRQPDTAKRRGRSCGPGALL